MNTTVKAFLDAHVPATQNFMCFIAQVLRTGGHPALTVAQELIVSRELLNSMLLGASAVAAAAKMHINTDELANVTEADYHEWTTLQVNVAFADLPRPVPAQSLS